MRGRVEGDRMGRGRKEEGITGGKKREQRKKEKEGGRIGEESKK